MRSASSTRPAVHLGADQHQQGRGQQRGHHHRLAPQRIGHAAHEQHGEGQHAGAQRQRQRAGRRADAVVATELGHQRLHAIQQAEGGEAGGEQRQVGAPERRRAVADRLAGDGCGFGTACTGVALAWSGFSGASSLDLGARDDRYRARPASRTLHHSSARRGLDAKQSTRRALAKNSPRHVSMARPPRRLVLDEDQPPALTAHDVDPAGRLQRRPRTPRHRLRPASATTMDATRDQVYTDAARGFSLASPDGHGTASRFPAQLPGRGTHGRRYAAPDSQGTPAAALVLEWLEQRLRRPSLRIGVSTDAQAVASCTVVPASGVSHRSRYGRPRQARDFAHFQAGDAAMSHYMQVQGYRTVHDGRCYAIDLWIEGTPAGSLRPASDATLQQEGCTACACRTRWRDFISHG